MTVIIFKAHLRACVGGGGTGEFCSWAELLGIDVEAELQSTHMGSTSQRYDCRCCATQSLGAWHCEAWPPQLNCLHLRDLTTDLVTLYVVLT
jgi:hypothetical protein